jgi:hypothetical protein
MGMRDCFGRPLPLHLVINVTDVFETKCQMLACHESQREWLRRANGIDDNLDQMEHDSQEQGELAGVHYGEGSIQHLGSGHPQGNLLKAVLGDRCLEILHNASSI